MTQPPEHIARPDFGIAVRGYDRSQVDAYFGRVVEWLADAENRSVAAERAREALSREVTDLRATITMLEDRAGVPAPQSMSAFSERMGQVMESALQAAQELRAEAEREARERRLAATEESERLVESARDQAEEIMDGARSAQRAMEESITDLRASRSEAVETLVDLQRRIAAVVGVPEPSIGGEAGEPGEVVDRAADGGVEDAADDADAMTAEGGDDVTMVVPAVSTTDEEVVATEAEPAPDDGVLVTAAPTIVQPAVGRGSDGKASTGRRRRSA